VQGFVLRRKERKSFIDVHSCSMIWCSLERRILLCRYRDRR